MTDVFCIWKILCHLLLVSVVSGEKLVFQIGVPLQLMCSNWCSSTVNVSFLFDSFKILPFSLVFINLIMYLGKDLFWIYPLVFIQLFWSVGYVFCQRVSAYFFEDFFITSLLFCFLDGNYLNTGSFLSSPHRRSSVYCFFSSFPICCLDWIDSIIMSSGSLILFSLNSILLFSLSSEIFF